MAGSFLPQRVHFIGVCGTAMGAVAIALQQRGVTVSGSDERVYPPMSDQLAAHGVRLLEGYRAENLTEDIELVVVGNAIARGNPELEAVMDRRLRYASLPETLRLSFLSETRNVVVTGTHGKTTTSSLTAWLLREAGAKTNWLIGGVPRGLGQGCVLAEGAQWCVLEGDEYDTAFFDKRSKFVHYLPEVLILNNLEFDHADIFDDLRAVQRSFSQVIRIVPRGGLILANGDDPNIEPLLAAAPAPVRRVGFGPDCEVQIVVSERRPEGSVFTLSGLPELAGLELFVPLLGTFNLRNAAMAVSAAAQTGLEPERIVEALATFPGVARRQDLTGEANGVRVVDDFAHHPTAIAEAVAGLRQRWPEGRLWAIFEPRSNTSRRKLMQEDLRAALATADLVVLAAVENPEKVPADQRLEPAEIIAALSSTGQPAWFEPDVDSIIERVVEQAQPGDTVAIFSNGGFDGIHRKLLAKLEAATAV